MPNEHETFSNNATLLMFIFRVGWVSVFNDSHHPPIYTDSHLPPPSLPFPQPVHGKGIQFGTQVQPVCLAPPEMEYQPGRKCTIAGWGSTGRRAGERRHGYRRGRGVYALVVWAL